MQNHHIYNRDNIHKHYSIRNKYDCQKASDTIDDVSKNPVNDGKYNARIEVTREQGVDLYPKYVVMNVNPIFSRNM